MKFKTLFATFLLAVSCLYSLHSVAHDYDRERGGNAYCEKYPSDSKCKGTKAYCDRYPSDAACKPSGDLCKNNPRHPDCRHAHPTPKPTPKPERSPKQCDSDDVLCKANNAQYNACRALKNTDCDRYLDDNDQSSGSTWSDGSSDTDDTIARAEEALHNACIALGRTDCD